MINITNKQFLKTVFRSNSDNVHVTDFTHDPNDIPKDQHMIAWMGGYFKARTFKHHSNQYFTISIFKPDEHGTARRRKVLFRETPVIVLDDVKEKLSMEAVSQLPKPSYILETSPGSEQWGYILNKPCTDRATVENLLDGLVANGLAPDGKDPGMKGVTRYVRLPEGYNTKKSKMVNGEPFKCRMTLWNPFNNVTMEELAKPFQVDLNASRREQRIDGAHNIPDHPLLHCGLNIKELRSDGRYDITCPWVDEHTDSIDDGSAIFTNEDGSPGFKCHHGACETKTARDLLNYIETQKPGFNDSYKEWQFKHAFADIAVKPKKIDMLDQLRHMEPGEKQRSMVSEYLKLIDSTPEIEKHHNHTEICDMMGWSKVDFGKIIKDMRSTWYAKEHVDFYDSFVWVKEQNRFYDYNTRIFFSAEAFQNSFCDLDPDARKNALTVGKVPKVDKIDFAPKMPKIFESKGIQYANTWISARQNMGVEGDCSIWLNHFDKLGWGENKKHLLQWMAFTLLHPETKINHIILLGGLEGTGKDFLLKPLSAAMAPYHKTEEGGALTSDFNSYLMNVKHLHLNETELGDHKKAREVSAKLKPLAAAPPNTLSINQKGIAAIDIRNIVSVSMTTNSQTPLMLDGPSRRFYAVWSDFNSRDSNGELIPELLVYFKEIYEWMDGEGIEKCIWYLRNCVDLSDFEPGSPPPTTDFLKSITENSKSPGQQTIEAFIDNRVGNFSNDVLTVNEICATLRAGAFAHDEFMYMNATWFTPTKVGRIMRDMNNCAKLRARGDVDMRVWVIRDKEKYEKMHPSELFDVYSKCVRQC